MAAPPATHRIAPGVKPPLAPDFGASGSTCTAENWKLFKQKWANYEILSRLQEQARAYQVALLLNTLGDEGLKIYNGFQFATDEDARTTAEIIAKFDVYAIGEINETYERFVFNKRLQQNGESFEVFHSSIRTLIKTCNYHNDSIDSILRDRIVLGIHDRDTQKLLLREVKLTLETCINICKAAENATVQGKVLRSDADTTIKRVREGRRTKPAASAQHKGKPKGRQYSGDSNAKKKPDNADAVVKECRYCGRTHQMIKEKCPAWGKTCDNCGGNNHFDAKCKKPKVRAVTLEDDNDYYLQNVTTKRKTRILTAKMAVNGCHLHFQLDTGAEVNTLCQRFVKKHQVKPSSKNLIMWNATRVKPVGEATLPLRNIHTGEEKQVQFVVVPNDFSCLLGVNTIQDMGLITVHNDRFLARIKTGEELGDLGEAILHVNPDVRPRTLPCRNVPTALKEDVKTEMDRLVELGVLVPVSEPTEWVSQMAVVRKANGKLRICIDPQALNEALMREHYKLPTLDDILPMLNKAKVFSKVDVKNAFWHVRLDYKSSVLTTMITPFGRFRWARLPFGLKVSSEIFQKKLTEALSGLNGTFTIADDITVAGCGPTKAEALKDNDSKLQTLYERCKESNIILNEDKKEIGKSEINFHGHRFTESGIKPDNSKVEAIQKMPAPTDVSGVKRICGMVQYMARFLPNLANDLGPLRALTRKDVEWNWSKACDRAFDTVKKKLTETPVLAYFDSSKEVKLQVDSSQDGVGAVLLQDGRPVEYASRSLTDSQRNWAQIEKELLSVCFGLERFDQYTYGVKVIVENDHKPLASILKKPLSQAPKRLQALLMRLHRYDVDFHFLKGTDLVIADTLSRAVVNCSEERPRIMAIDCFTNISDARLEEVREVTSRDSSMQTLMSLLRNGWPETKQEVPPDARPYFDYRDTLTYDSGVILKGEAILIPTELRSDMKSRLHSAHLGYNSMLRRARGLVFWPGLTQDIKQMVDNCEPCQELRARSPKEPLIPQDDGLGPWDKVASDIFEISGRQYLVTIDCYSNYIEVDYLSRITSAQVITVLKKHFARYGIPRILLTDAGAQLTSSDFRKFTKEWGIIHIESSPGHHSANGRAEAAVKVAKQLMIKAQRTKTDPYIALLELRNTPREDTGLSPTEMLMGHKTRSIIPCVTKRETNESQGRIQRKQAMQRSHDKKTCTLSKLCVNQSVYFEQREKERWILGKIVDILGDRTYLVESRHGGVYRRNRSQMRPTEISFIATRDPPFRFPSVYKPAEPSSVDTYPVEPENPTGTTTTSPEVEARPQQNQSVIAAPPGPTLSEPIKTPEIIPRRSSRISRPPKHLANYVTK